MSEVEREEGAGATSADVAVIGMACRLPGAPSYEAFWENLVQGRSSVREIPAERWDWRRYWGDPESEANRCNSRWGGFLDAVDTFDARFFGVSRRDAELWDPQQRIMLQLAWECLEDAGLRPSSLWGSKVGVYVGSAVLDYKELLEEAGIIEAQYAAGVAHSVIASRISHWFNFTGPSVPMDTACASSLYAIHLAVQSLRRGECRLALAGGVNVLLTPRRYISFSKMGILSPTGACRSFDDAADGTVRGEGAGLVLLKPLSQALADGDPIHGIIKGSAINHSGKTHTLSYPNPVAQAEVIRDAWRDARVEPRTVSYVEAHGTGTPKGDPLEFDGLRRAFDGVAGARCGIGSVKTNIGHLESAAGVAGVIKVLLSMQHRQLPPLQGFRALNHRITLEGTPFHFVDSLMAWQPPSGEADGTPVRAGVSSFGFAGTNAHLVIEEAPKRASGPVSPRTAPWALVCLSAKTEDALRRAAASLGRWLAQRGDQVDLAGLAAALLGVKERFAERAAFLVEDLDALVRSLKRFSEGAAVEGLWRGRAGAEESPLFREVGNRILEELGNEAGPGEAARREKLGALGELYVKGVELDWTRWSKGPTPRDLRLPPYPFEEERFWIPGRAEAPLEGDSSRWLHPLVHENVSDLGSQRFASTFRGTEPFLAHHVVRGERVLPASAFLEMARAAVARSLPGAEGAAVRLREVVFIRPLRVGAIPRRVEIALVPEGDGQVSFRITSTGEDGGATLEHCEGRAAALPSATVAPLDVEAVRAACTRGTLDGAACYQVLRRLGFEHGPSHQGIESATLGEQAVVTRLRTTGETVRAAWGAGLPPGLLDAALQSVPVLMASAEGPAPESERLPVPFSVEELDILGRWPDRAWVWVRSRAGGGDERRFDLELCDEAGVVAIRLRGFAVRWTSGEPSRAPAATGRVLAVRTWEAWAPPAVPPVRAASSWGRRLVLLCEAPAGLVSSLAARLPGARCRALSAEGKGVAGRFVSVAAGALEEVRGVLGAMPPGGALVQVVFPAGPSQRLASALGGLLKTAHQEHPAFVGQTIELERLDDPASIEEALRACAVAPLEAEVAFRGSRQMVARWREVAAGTEGPWPLVDGGVYLLSGGVGGLGLVVAEAIARQVKGAVLHLVGRSPLSEEKARRLAALEALGCRPRFWQVDVARRDAVEGLVAHLRAEHGGLNGVVHAAGVLRDDFILRKDRAALEAVLAAKVHGAVNLDEATAGMGLDFFLLFSSVAGVLGNAGQADYAMANAFLDAYAALRDERRAAGERSGLSLSLDWPLWREGGMRVDPEVERALWERLGMSAIETSAGLAALRRAMGSGASQVLFMEGDVERLRRLLEGPVVADEAVVAEATAVAPEGLAGLEERAVELVKRELSVVLKVAPARMDADASMESHGIDSIAVTQLTRQLERTFGPLPRTLFFEYRTLRELAAHLLQAHGQRMQEALGEPAGQGGSPRAPAVEATVARRRAAPSGRFLSAADTPPARPRASEVQAPIAIVGVAGRYPGARNLRELWANLRDGKDCVTEIPLSRWDHRLYFAEGKGRPGKTSSKWGGFIDGVDEFDPLFFNISPREAEIMDPQERLFLQCVHETLEDAGYTRQSLRPRPGESGVGVFVGVMWEEYPLYAAQEQARGRNVTVTGSPASIANRVSYVYDFDGPSMAVDTMCSSSLTAVHLACHSLQRGECSAAVAGGVNVSIHPNKYLALAAGGYVSSQGRCQSFGEGGDGYVPGEGVGAVLLKPLARAVADGDHIYGVIKGTAVNHGGKTNGFTVPSPRAQGAVIGAALKAAGVSPREVSYIEAHGTGTSLGDPIEIAGLTKAFEAAGVLERGFCAIGSAKSNIGHCESAAGVAGLSKVLLQLKHRQLAPSLHAERLNPGIQFEQTPFRVQRTLADWAPEEGDGGRGRLRVAGVSSFGAGGSNAHLIVEEHEGEPVADAAAQGPVVVPLSARSEERLRASAAQLLEAVRAEPAAAGRLADLAYTLQVGREAMEERLALVVTTASELEAKLVAFLDGQRAVDGVFRGRATGGARTVVDLAADEDMARTLDAWVDKQKYAKLVALWVEGLPLDWERLHRGQRPRRMSLPTYPFSRERYWVPRLEVEAAEQAAAGSRPARHPLLHENTSDLTAQRFASTFTGGESFLEDHLVGGRRVLPAAVQLELARAAVEAAAGRLQAGGVVRLDSVVWLAPAAPAGGVLELSTELVAEEDGAVHFEIRRQGELSTKRPGDASEGDTAVVSRGVVVLGPPPAPVVLDLAALQARCGEGVLEGDACYLAFEGQGIVFGPTHRGLRRIHRGRGEALAELALPAVGEACGAWGLEPAMLDSALQSAIALLVGEGGGYLPFSLSSLAIHGPLERAMWAHVRRAEAGQAEGMPVFDLDVCDGAGRLRVRAVGLALRRAPKLEAGDDEMEAALVAPVWGPVASEPPALEPVRDGRTLVIEPGGVGPGERPPSVAVAVLDAAACDTEASLMAAVGALGIVRRVVWVAPEVPEGAHRGEALLLEQRRGTLHLFRLVKALLGLGYGSRPLDWTVVTTRCLGVSAGDVVEPAHAGVHGLAGAMAEELPGWTVRLVDVDRRLGAEALCDLAVQPGGRVQALRAGQWYQRRLLPVEGLAPGRGYGRDGGVYVVIGGAGGVGEVWSEHVLRAHRAQLVWIGRRTLDAAIQAKIDRLGTLGPAPYYVQADATRGESLRAALEAIKGRFGQVHGLVHSAIVLRDRSLANLDEASFLEAYAAKVDSTVHMAEVFEGEPLDFALFFSSTLGLVPSAGQSNYAAGCAFEDAFARRLAGQWRCPVKVMNWGYWGHHGVVAGSAYRERMARLGVGSIEPVEAMAALDALMGAPLPQMAFIKTTPRGRLASTTVAEALWVGPEAVPEVLPALHLTAPAGAVEVAAAVEAEVAEERELLEDLLALQLERSGVDWRSSQALPGRVPDFYRLWLEESRAILAARQAGDRGDPWARWQRAKEAWGADPGRRAKVTLLETALAALPDILVGARRAPEVLFPGGSFELVEGIYRGNAAADLFNAAAAEAVAAYLEERLRREPSASVRILEVGAGTGAGSAAIRSRLEGYSAHLAEYCFTDLSLAFVLEAQAAHGRRWPFVTARRLDVGAPVAGQGVEPGSYDLAVAVNVLHATPDVRRALRNVKAALKKNGVLVINELSQRSLFGHLTFGLLEGWWLHQDAALRIQGTPALAPESWRRALEEEGFTSVRFPAAAAHRAGQQIILAQSDGVVRQDRAMAPMEAGQRPQTSSAGLAVVDPGRAMAAEVEGPREPEPEPDALRARAREYLKKAVGEVLKVDPGRLRTDEPLGRYGIDSILVSKLTSAIRGVFGDVKSTLWFEHQTIDAAVEALSRTHRQALAALASSDPPATQMAPGAHARPPSQPSPRSRLRRAVAPGEPKQRDRAGGVAIVGLAGRYPKARDVRAFWENLRAGRSCISEVPLERWDWRDYFGEERGRWGTLYSKFGGFIDDIARFDPALFRLSPREAAQMDPQERQFLEVAYASIEDAGYTPSGLSPSRQVGVFVGVMNAHYGHGPTHWSIANRVSYVLDLHGPSLAVDTACSSSLTAIHLALDALKGGSCECAIAGGVNLIVDPVHPMRLAAASMLSPGDQCRAFGAGADGMVDGEAVGAVVLKPLARAVADGDHIYGVIRGSMLNSGGRTNGYTVPNPAAQGRVIAEALRRAEIDPRMVSYLEAHGTGTELGDPIEIAGLISAFGQGTGDRQFCALGSVKSNIGHSESAAGIAGLTKVLLQMKHRELVPSLHAQAPNPRIDFTSSPFVLQQTLGPWTRPSMAVDGSIEELPRIAGVSSFGAGGANAHLVVEEHQGEVEAAADVGPAVVVLSARTERDLREKARHLAEALEEDALGDGQLADLAFTLQVGRESMEERLGVITSSMTELRQHLAGFAGGTLPTGCRRGRAAPGGVAEVEPHPEETRLEAVLDLWLRGGEVDWAHLHRARRPRRLSLPTYPFGGDRYWAPVRWTRPAPRASATVAPEPEPATSARPAEPVPTRKAAGRPPPVVLLRPPGEPRSEVVTAGASGRRPPPVRLRPLGAPGAAEHPVAPAPAPEPPSRPAPPVAPRAPAPPAGPELKEDLVSSLAKALYMQPGEVDVDKKFVDLGMDSIVGVEWIKAVNKKYGTSLRATVVYDHPDLRSFERFLRSELAHRPSAEAGPAPASASVVSPAPAPPVRSLRELLLQVQRGEVSVEEASRLHSKAGREASSPGGTDA